MSREILDFFISYTSPDRAWAEWIAWQLENDGAKVAIQAWDFRPGQNFVVAMQEAAANASRTVSVISPAFFESPFTGAEWAAAFTEDPDGKEAKYVPVRVRDCSLPGLHKAIIYIDLVGLDERSARTALLQGVSSRRVAPTQPPAFPGARAGMGSEHPPFPGESPPIWNVPLGTRSFKGRTAALEGLARGLLGDGRAAVVQAQAVHGLGGIGKTQLAARFAHEHRAEYDVVWWIRAEQAATCAYDLAALGNHLGLGDASGDQADLVSATRTWLEQSGRWLLIFDNATDPESVSPWLPAAGNGHVIITSRRHADWKALGASRLPLDTWEREESIDFLTDRTDCDDRDSASAIADLLGDLPLALAQAGAYISEQAISLSTYHVRLRDRTSQMLREGKPLDYEYTVATTWDLALEQIGRTPLAGAILNFSAYLAPERIPRELLAAFATQTGGNERALDDAMQLALSYALVVPAQDETLDMHRLLQHVVREQQDTRERKEWARNAVDALSSAFPERPWEPQHSYACGRLLPHARAVAAHGRALGVDRAALGGLLSTCSRILRERGDFWQSRELDLEILTIAEELGGADSAPVAITLNNLSISLTELDMLEESRAALERALAIDEGAQPDSVSLAETLGNLGIVLVALDEPGEARTIIERALTIFEEHYGVEHSTVARNLGNLGSALLKLGEAEEARRTQERVLRIEQQEYGAKHPEVARTLANLGNTHLLVDDLSSALDVLQQALTIFEEWYADHPEVGRTLISIGQIQVRQGDTEAGRQNIERGVAVLEGSLGENHADTQIAVRAIAELG